MPAIVSDSESDEDKVALPSRKHKRQEHFEEDGKGGNAKKNENGEE